MFYEKLLEELRSYKKETENLILRDQAEDFASYRHLVGKLKAVEDVIDICRETFKRSNNV